MSTKDVLTSDEENYTLSEITVYVDDEKVALAESPLTPAQIEYAAWRQGKLGNPHDELYDADGHLLPRDTPICVKSGERFCTSPVAYEQD
jgi:hypothetical protein